MNSMYTDTANSTASYMSQDVRVEPSTKLEIPIPILVPGSIVKWTVDVAQGADILFGIRRIQNVVGTGTGTEPKIHWIVEKQTVCHYNDDDDKGMATLIDDEDEVVAPVTGEFIAVGVDGGVETLVLEFDNMYSWMTEKRVSYSVTVSPPTPPMSDSTVIERSTKRVPDGRPRIGNGTSKVESPRIQTIQELSVVENSDTLILTTPIKAKPKRRTKKNTISCPTQKHDGKSSDNTITTISINGSSSSISKNNIEKDEIVIGIKKEQQVQEVIPVVGAPPVEELEEKEEKELAGKPIIVIVGATSKFTLINPVSVTKQEQGIDGCDSDGKAENNSDNDDVPKWGLGGALAIPFAERGYHIVLMGRRIDVLEDVQQSVKLVHQKWWRNKNKNNNNNTNCSFDDDDEKRQQQQQEQQFPKVLSVVCDVTDDTSVQQAFQKVSNHIEGTTSTNTGHNTSNSNSNHRRFFPPKSYIDVVIYNVAPPYPPGFKFAQWGDVLQPHHLETTNMSMQFDTLVNGLLRVCQQPTVIPDMIKRQHGCLLVSGESCCNLHGGYEFGGVAPGRAALRSLTQSMFRAYGPQGIHVCNMNIGGIIDTPRTRTWSAATMPKLTNPYEIAEQYFMVYQQPSTVWSYELQLCPSFSAREVDMRM